MSNKGQLRQVIGWVSHFCRLLEGKKNREVMVAVQATYNLTASSRKNRGRRASVVPSAKDLEGLRRE